MAVIPDVMDEARMDGVDAARCRWIGWTITKGVVHPDRNIVRWGERGSGKPSLHGELVQRFGGTDPCPRCYDRDAPVGFGGFFRLVRFEGKCQAITGVDWSPDEAPHIGVATRAKQVGAVAASLLAFGFDPSEELVLLTWRMTEQQADEDLRRTERLWTVGDWAAAQADQTRCPACGRRTATRADHRFCWSCGNPFSHGGPHGMEAR